MGQMRLLTYRLGVRLAEEIWPRFRPILARRANRRRTHSQRRAPWAAGAIRGELRGGTEDSSVARRGRRLAEAFGQGGGRRDLRRSRARGGARLVNKKGSGSVAGLPWPWL